jgi:uncharacterized protein
MAEELPAFRYYADPIADGRITPSAERCAACDRVRGWISGALLYSDRVPDEARFCPWCIADGTAVARFGGTFNEVWESIPRERAILVTERTPNFETWQDWAWPCHCNDAACYRGQPSGTELRANPEALESLLTDLRQYEWGRDETYVAEFIDGLGGGAVAYLFECLECHAQIVVWDSD